jgi:hypothetical protein
MTEIMAQGYRLREVLVEPESPGDGAGDLHHLQRVCQPGAEMIPIRRDEYLGLVHQTPKCLGVYYAVTVTLKVAPHAVERFGSGSSGGLRAGF